MHQALARPPAPLLERAESSLGAFVASLVILGTGGVVAIAAALDPDVTRRSRIVFTGFALVWLALDVPYGLRLWYCVWTGRHPVALEVALSTPRRAWPVRVFTATWWSAHYVIGVAALVTMERAGPTSGRGVEDAAWPAQGFVWVASLTALFSIAYVTNGFLLMALTATGLGTDGVQRVWRSRFVIDAVLALAAFGLMRV
jgi:hypothetical protein